MHRPTLMLLAAVASLTLAAPASADGEGLQFTVGFEAVGDLDGVGDAQGVATRFTCRVCEMREATDPAYPAHGGTRQLWASDFDVAVEDPFNISWPGIGAFVTGAATVFATFYRYDYDAAENVEFLTLEVPGGGAANIFLGLGFDDPQVLTRVSFHSDASFSLDDLVIGRTDIGPGIPEPATWALMLSGFFGMGASLRRQRRGAASAA